MKPVTWSRPRRGTGGLAAAVLSVLLLGTGCGGGNGSAGRTVVTFSGSAVGSEARVLRKELDRFETENPDLRVEVRPTPDAADQRHQLYVQWLNARARDPDVLQLDVVWTPEFAAAGWILPLERFRPDTADFFAAALRADRWRDTLYAVPWFVDAGMLYWRTDLVDAPPVTLEELVRTARRATGPGGVPDGFVWQGARYEGLVTTFVEHLGAFGGHILDENGRVVVDSDAGIHALRFMRREIDSGVAPRSVLTWREEQTRFAFQNGNAVYMRNWPYAAPLLQDTARSAVAGRFSVAPMPAGPGGSSTAALGGAQLAVNAHSDHPEAAWRVVRFLTRPGEMLERARRTGEYPARRSVFADTALAGALAVAPARALRIVERAVPRPVTPVYSQLSSILQIWLHRALSGQADPADALHRAASQMRRLLEKVELAPPENTTGG